MNPHISGRWSRICRLGIITFNVRRPTLRESFPAVIRHTESPTLRSAPAPMRLLSQSVRAAGLKVVLTGEGADEVLGGYDIFKEAKVRRFWSRESRARRGDRCCSSVCIRTSTWRVRRGCLPAGILRQWTCGA